MGNRRPALPDSDHEDASRPRPCPARRWTRARRLWGQQQRRYAVRGRQQGLGDRLGRRIGRRVRRRAQASASSGASGVLRRGGAVSASDKAFCDTFSSAKDRFGTQAGLPTGEDIKKIKQFADDLEKTAPAEIKDDAAVLADYFRFIADVAGKERLPSAAADLQQEITKVQPAIIHVSTWSATHCSNELARDP